MTATRLMQMFSLEGRKAVVTGASSGLGRHFALVLAEAGAEVFACARRADRLTELGAEIKRRGGRARAITMDVTDRASVCAALDAVGAVDVLVNNAGVSDTKRVLDYADKDWDAITGTDLKGAWIMAQETARRMADAKLAGSIVNIF